MENIGRKKKWKYGRHNNIYNKIGMRSIDFTKKVLVVLAMMFALVMNAEGQ